MRSTRPNIATVGVAMARLVVFKSIAGLHRCAREARYHHEMELGENVIFTVKDKAIRDFPIDQVAVFHAIFIARVIAARVDYRDLINGRDCVFVGFCGTLASFV